MRNWRQNLFWIWLSLFLAMAGFSFAYPIMPFLLVDQYGVSDPQTRDLYISLFTFCGNLGFLIFSPIWGRLSDVYGRKSMMTRANFCSMILLPLLVFMPSANALVVLRFVIGAAAGIVSAAMTLVACSTPESNRGMAMGSISSAIFSGNLAGMVAGGFCASSFGYTVTFMLCGVMMLVATLISAFLVREDRSTLPKNAKFNWPHLGIPKLGKAWYLMLLMLWMGMAQCMDGPFLPVLVDLVLNADSATALRWNGILGGVCAAAGIFGGFIIGVMADRYPGNQVGIVISGCAAFFLLPQVICHSLGLLFLERVLMTFFVSGLSPITQTWLSLVTEPEKRGLYFGYATSCRAIGWLVGGMVGMVTTYYFGTRSVFAAGAVVMLGMAFLIAFVQKRVPFKN